MKRTYKIVPIRRTAEDTERLLNVLAIEGWKLVCSYAKDNEWLILEKEEK